MSQPEQALWPVVNHLTEWVRERGSVSGARIGAELARVLPSFDL